MKDLGIQTLGQVQTYPEALLVRKLGKFAHRLKELAGGHDASAVTPQSETKSISTETTLDQDTRDRQQLGCCLLGQSQRVARELRAKRLRARTVSLILKTADFQRHSRSRTLATPVQSADRIYHTVLALLQSYAITQPVRLIGVGASGLRPADSAEQCQLFPDDSEKLDRKWEQVEQAMDAVADRFGASAVKRGN